jgi:D-cysteine desulfhydrase
VKAAAELQAQLDERHLAPEKTVIVTATGTGGTQVGLTVGFRLLGLPVRVIGLDIGRLWRAFPRTLARLANESCRLLGVPAEWKPADFPLSDYDYAGPGYARLTREVRDAIYLVARTEGILLDPVYSGKAFVGLLDLLRQGRFADDEQIIFLHTGGSPALWAYGEELGPA